MSMTLATASLPGFAGSLRALRQAVLRRLIIIFQPPFKNDIPTSSSDQFLYLTSIHMHANKDIHASLQTDGDTHNQVGFLGLNVIYQPIPNVHLSRAKTRSGPEVKSNT